MKISKNYLILFLIILVGFVLRVYQMKVNFIYNHDHDLASWIVRDIVVNRHFRLIGQLTSTPGIFIGPLYYYFQVPFFLLFKMDPIAQVWASVTVGIFGILSAYWVLKQIYNQKTGLIAAFLYAIPFFVISNDREAVPTVPVILWSIWFYYALHLIANKKGYGGYILTGVLLGLIWHLNMSLIILLPLLIFAQLWSRKKISLSDIVCVLVPFITLSLPLILFEIRHGFSQSKAFLFSLAGSQGDIYSGFAKFVRVLSLINKNIGNYVEIGLIALLGLFVFLIFKKYFSKFQGLAILLWLGIYIAFFSTYTKIVSEYYLNGLFAVYLVILARFLYFLSEKYKYLFYLAIVGLLMVNMQKFISYRNPGNGYLPKMALVEAIKNDVTGKGYGCAAISYITSPGYDLGYRYFFYLKGLKLSSIKKDVPVYTIVFPLGRDSVKEDARFGNIGLIYPKTSGTNCDQNDYNITVPMFGFVN